MNEFFSLFLVSISFIIYYAVSANEELLRVKRQDDDGDAGQSIEELCHDRPADEYFRLNTEGDCRDVVRYVS